MVNRMPVTTDGLLVRPSTTTAAVIPPANDPIMYATRRPTKARVGTARIARSSDAASAALEPDGIANTSCRAASSRRITTNAVPGPATQAPRVRIPYPSVLTAGDNVIWDNMDSMRRVFPWALALTVAAFGCSQSNQAPTPIPIPLAPADTTDTFSGTLSILGTNYHQFCVQTPG